MIYQTYDVHKINPFKKMIIRIFGRRHFQVHEAQAKGWMRSFELIYVYKGDVYIFEKGPIE